MSRPMPIRLSDEERERIREMASAQGITASDVVRAALDRYYKLYKAKGALKGILQADAEKRVVRPIAAPVVQPPAERGVGWTD